jgi:hypothetical protein
VEHLSDAPLQVWLVFTTLYFLVTRRRRSVEGAVICRNELSQGRTNVTLALDDLQAKVMELLSSSKTTWLGKLACLSVERAPRLR